MVTPLQASWIRPCRYGAPLWGCTKRTNVDIVQRLQDKVLRNIVYAPWYIQNTNLHRDHLCFEISDCLKK